MARKIVLDNLKKKGEEKAQNIELELEGGTVVLRNPLQMSREDRKELRDYFKEQSRLAEEREKAEEEGREVEDGDEDIVDSLLAVFEILIGDKAGFDLLVEEIGDNAAVLSALMEEYNEKGEVGEA